MPTFTDPIINCDSESVYAPSDDTYLMLDYFKSNINNSYFDGIKMGEIKNILDLGTGTGLIAIFFQLIKMQILNFNPKIYASDILKEAICCAKLNEKANKINNEIIFLHSNLFNTFPDNLKHSFNIIMFNPPYLPSFKLIKGNINKENIDYSWDGGVKGYEVIIRFLDQATEYLNYNLPSYIYFISSSRLDLEPLHQKIKNKGFKNLILEKTHIFFEDIILNRLEPIT